MGMKLKSGADLCGFELSRFCVQNDVAIPDAPASGRKYFHTGTGMEGKYSLLGRERIFTGTSWRAAAYVDDLANLDLATNEDYLALKEKVELLSGEVDTDAIISNMKEVTAFLEGFAEDASLMDLLNSKFDKTGGTINGRVTIDNNNWASQLILNGTNTSAGIKFQKAGVGEGILYSNGGILKWYKSSSDDQTLLHSGNVGDYALKTDGSNAMQVGIKFNVFNIDLNVGLGDGIRLIDRSGANGPTGTTWWQTFSAVGSNGGFQFSTFPSHEKSLVFLRTCGNSESSWKDWREIAFTDSTVEAAKKLETPRKLWGNDFDGTADVSGHLVFPNSIGIYGTDTSGETCGLLALDSSNTLYVGAGAARAGYNTYLSGDNIYLRYSQSPTIGLILNSSGNVTIGYADFARSKWKTFITGNTFVYSLVDANARPTLGNIPEGVFSIGYHSNGDVLYGLHMWSENSGNGVIQASRADGTAKKFSILLNPLGGKVGVGLTSPSAQLHVNEDIVANGTIACKGVAAEGSAPVGTVDKWAGTIAIGTKSQPYTHGLGTTDITVAIYEKNGNEWVQILTDVDIVNANTIRVTFGANTTVEHRIVVMG